MKKIILFIISIFILLNILKVYWCSCVWNTTPYEAYRSADVVFIWKPIKLEEIWRDRQKGKGIFFPANKLYTFEVSKSFKWNWKKPIIIETQGFDSCSIGFKQNTSYFVYAYKDWDYYNVKSCGRTKYILRAEEDVKLFDLNNLYILLLKIYKLHILWILILILSIFFWYKIKQNKKSKKLKLIKNTWKK
mgnify:CR=1 FL=1